MDVAQQLGWSGHCKVRKFEPNNPLVMTTRRDNEVPAYETFAIKPGIWYAIQCFSENGFLIEYIFAQRESRVDDRYWLNIKESIEADNLYIDGIEVPFFQDSSIDIMETFVEGRKRIDVLRVLVSWRG